MTSNPRGDEFAAKVLGEPAAELDTNALGLDPIDDVIDLELVGTFCTGGDVSRERVVVAFDYHRHTVVIDGTGSVRRVVAKRSPGVGHGSDDD